MLRSSLGAISSINVSLYFSVQPCKMLPNLVRQLVTCPLSGRVMTEPVFASDGYAYERVVLEKWMETNAQSPVTREALGATILPATLISELIRLVGNQALGPSEYKLTIPSKYIGYLIGRKGRTIQKIQSATGTKIEISQENEPCILTFTGGDVNKAVTFASKVIGNIPPKQCVD